MRESDTSNEEKDDDQNCPSSTEHQEAPGIGDAVGFVEVAKVRVDEVSVAVEQVNS